MITRPLCLYDGIKLRSYDIDYIEWLKLDAQRHLFNLKPTFDKKVEQILSYQGKFENIKINIHYCPKGWVVDFSGSVHKLFNILKGNGSINYNDFYWDEFLEVVKQMITIFKFDPDTLEVVNLEIGVNCRLPFQLKLTISQIIENILFVANDCNNRSRIVGPRRDTYICHRGDYYLKMYDKGIQNKLEYFLQRFEKGYTRSRSIAKNSGVKTLNDLTKESARLFFEKDLIAAFDNLHFFQLDLMEMPEDEIKKTTDILSYGQHSYWCGLRKEKSTRYKQHKKNHDRLIDTYCSYNLATVIQQMLREKLRCLEISINQL